MKIKIDLSIKLGKANLALQYDCFHFTELIPNLEHHHYITLFLVDVEG